MKRHKKAQIPAALMGAISMVMFVFIIAFIIGLGSSITETVQSQCPDNDANASNTNIGYCANASGDGLVGLDSMSNFQPTIALVGVAIIIITILMSLIGVIAFRKIKG